MKNPEILAQICAHIGSTSSKALDDSENVGDTELPSSTTDVPSGTEEEGSASSSAVSTDTASLSEERRRRART